MVTPLRVLLLEDQGADAALILRTHCQAGFEPAWQCVKTEEDYLVCLNDAVQVILAE